MNKKLMKIFSLAFSSTGVDWLNSLMKRQNLTKHITDNVKASRAEVNAEIINEYFDNLTKTLENIPASNDETIVTDDPGAQMVETLIS